jgi:hypothetical protein
MVGGVVIHHTIPPMDVFAEFCSKFLKRVRKEKDGAVIGKKKPLKKDGKQRMERMNQTYLRESILIASLSPYKYGS